jgi:serine phosphatase RsbU (regulator of sigma subunit)
MFFRRKKGGSAAEPRSESAESSVGRGPTNTSSTQFLTGDDDRDQRTVQVLLEAIAGVSGSRDLESLLVDIVDRSIEVTDAERGFLLLRDEGGEGGLTVRVGRQRGGQELTGDLRFSTSVAGKVLDEEQALRATVQSGSDALELGRSVYDLKLRAVMCVPLKGVGKDAANPATGVLYVDSRAASRQFGRGDLALFAALAQHISIALENARLHLDSLEKVRLEQSLELASAIQRDLMPGVPTDLPGWDVHGWYGPAEQAAGDFYDFVRTKAGGRAVVVGDVTGHGIGPALITATAQAGLRSYLRLIEDVGEVVTLLNQDLCERMEDGRFLTLFLAVLGDDGQLEALNGGHAPPFLYRAQSKAVEEIELNGPALGMVDDERYSAHPHLTMASGDVLVVYTDGLVEARDPADHDRMFGEDGLRLSMHESIERGDDARAMALHVVDRAMELSGGLREDDITVVVVRRT